MADTTAKRASRAVEKMGMAVALCDELEASVDPVKTFILAGGRLSSSCGTNVARLFGFSASCTVDEPHAVKAWIRAVRRKAGAS